MVERTVEAPAVTLRRAAERVRDLGRGSEKPERQDLIADLLDAVAAEVEHDDLALQRDLVDDPDSLICRAGYLLALDVLGEKR